MTLMKSLWYTADRVMTFKKVPVPEIKEGNYLIKVVSTGICGSDFEGYLGKTGRRVAPMIMGHEFSGKIAKAPENGRYKEGESVTVFPKPFCGECEYCRNGMENVCPSGIMLGVMDVNGSMCEYIEVEEKYIIPFSGISYDAAAMTEPLAVAYRAVHKISDEELAKANHILVIGAGTIGLLAVAVLKYRGAKHIIVSDACDFRLDVAKKMGADDVINPRTDKFLTKLRELTDCHLADISVEAVGIEPTASDSLSALRVGGIAVWIGNAQKMIEVNMQKIVTSELTIRGNYIYSFKEFGEALKLLESKKIDVSPLMTDRYPLEDGAKAFKDLENNKEGKMLKVFLENE